MKKEDCLIFYFKHSFSLGIGGGTEGVVFIRVHVFLKSFQEHEGGGREWLRLYNYI